MEEQIEEKIDSNKRKMRIYNFAVIVLLIFMVFSPTYVYFKYKRADLYCSQGLVNYEIGYSQPSELEFLIEQRIRDFKYSGKECKWFFFKDKCLCLENGEWVGYKEIN